MKPMERDLPHLRSSGRREFPVAGRDGTVDWHLALVKPAARRPDGSMPLDKDISGHTRRPRPMSAEE